MYNFLTKGSSDVILFVILFDYHEKNKSNEKNLQTITELKSAKNSRDFLK